MLTSEEQRKTRVAPLLSSAAECDRISARLREPGSGRRHDAKATLVLRYGVNAERRSRAVASEQDFYSVHADRRRVAEVVVVNLERTCAISLINGVAAVPSELPPVHEKLGIPLGSHLNTKVLCVGVH